VRFCVVRGDYKDQLHSFCTRAHIGCEFLVSAALNLNIFMPHNQVGNSKRSIQ